MKKLRIALVIGALISTLGATFYLAKGNISTQVAGPSANTNTHILRIDSFYQTGSYNPGVGYTGQYKIGVLENEGNYFFYSTNLDSSGVETVYGNGHMVSITSCNEYVNKIGVGVDPEKAIHDIYFNEDDYNAGKPIPLRRFNYLRSVKLVMGEENQVELRVGDIFGVNYLTYDEETRTYTFEIPNDTLTGKTICANFYFTNDFVGKRFVLDEVILNYDC